MDAAVNNLEFLRRLIEESRQPVPQADADRLRMIFGQGVGTDSMPSKQEDR
jgi:hypothetical protein